MPLTQFELVMLENGDIALQKTGSDEPLVSIRFSEEVLDALGKQHLDVAKSMIDAGIQAVSEASEDVESETEHHTLH